MQRCIKGRRKKTNNRINKLLFGSSCAWCGSHRWPGVPSLLTQVNKNTTYFHPSTRGSSPQVQHVPKALLLLYLPKYLAFSSLRSLASFCLSSDFMTSMMITGKYGDVSDEKDTQRSSVELSQNTIPLPPNVKHTTQRKSSFHSNSLWFIFNREHLNCKQLKKHTK